MKPTFSPEQEMRIREMILEDRQTRIPNRDHDANYAMASDHAKFAERAGKAPVRFGLTVAISLGSSLLVLGVLILFRIIR